MPSWPREALDQIEGHRWGQPPSQASAWCLACPAGVAALARRPRPSPMPCLRTEYRHASLHTPLHKSPSPPAPFLLSWLYECWVSLWPCLSLSLPIHLQGIPSPPLSAPPPPGSPTSQSLVFRSLLLSPALFPALLRAEWEQGTFLVIRLNILMQSHYSPGVQAGQASPSSFVIQE